MNIGGQHIAARYWYDGQYVNNAREDAAERALQALGQMAPPQGPQPSQYQAQVQQQQQQHQQQPQRAFYGSGTGAVGS